VALGSRRKNEAKRRRRWRREGEDGLGFQGEDHVVEARPGIKVERGSM
jgi:hypothetical protein